MGFSNLVALRGGQVELPFESFQTNIAFVLFFFLSWSVIKSASINVLLKILQWILISGLVPITQLKRGL